MTTGCHCLCAVNHPEEPGICTGWHQTTVMLEVSWQAERVPAKMCTPCADATIDTTRRGWVSE